MFFGWCSEPKRRMSCSRHVWFKSTVWTTVLSSKASQLLTCRKALGSPSIPQNHKGHQNHKDHPSHRAHQNQLNGARSEVPILFPEPRCSPSHPPSSSSPRHLSRLSHLAVTSGAPRTSPCVSTPAMAPTVITASTPAGVSVTSPSPKKDATR